MDHLDHMDHMDHMIRFAAGWSSIAHHCHRQSSDGIRFTAGDRIEFRVDKLGGPRRHEGGASIMAPTLWHYGAKEEVRLEPWRHIMLWRRGGDMVSAIEPAPVPWRYGATVLAPWCYGAMPSIPWHQGTVVPIPWRHGAMVLWGHGNDTMVLWRLAPCRSRSNKFFPDRFELCQSAMVNLSGNNLAAR